MENRLTDIDELIGKYLAGEASSEEILTVDSWRRAHDDNQKYFDQFKLIFAKATLIKDTLVVDEDAAWNKIKAKIRQGSNSDEQKVVPFHPQRSYALYWRVAASIILLVTAGFFTFRYMTTTDSVVEVVAEKKTVTDTLPDGSEVVLNRKSQLSYQFDKNKKAHTVKLKGEAYFSINHEAEKNFIIDISGVYVRDIGTSFNVKAYPESNTIEVVVEEGEVIFYTDSDSGITLRAGGKGVYDKVTKKFSVDQPEKNVTAYKTRVFVFNNSTVGNVVDELSSVYERKIIVSDLIRNCPITVDFDNESIEEIAAVIADTHGWKIKETEAGIVLEGSGCLN